MTRRGDLMGILVGAALGLCLGIACAHSGTKPMLAASGAGTLCAPVTTGGMTSTALDYVSNVTSGPIEIVDVALDDDAVNLRLVSAGATLDLTRSHSGQPFGYASQATGPGTTPFLVPAGEDALVEVQYELTGASYGWTKGLWVTAQTETGRLFKVHTCGTTIIQPPDTVCGDQMDTVIQLPPDRDAVCGVTVLLSRDCSHHTSC